MADFVAVIRKAVDSLPNNTPENRAKVYDKARAAIRRQLEAINPPPSDEVIARQLELTAILGYIGAIDEDQTHQIGITEPASELFCLDVGRVRLVESAGTIQQDPEAQQYGRLQMARSWCVSSALLERLQDFAERSLGRLRLTQDSCTGCVGDFRLDQLRLLHDRRAEQRLRFVAASLEFERTAACIRFVHVRIRGYRRRVFRPWLVIKLIEYPTTHER